MKSWKRVLEEEAEETEPTMQAHMHLQKTWINPQKEALPETVVSITPQAVKQEPHVDDLSDDEDEEERAFENKVENLRLKDN